MLVESFSGIRGVFGEDLTLAVARKYATLFYYLTKEKANTEPTIVIGHDTRPSAKEMMEAVCRPFKNIIYAGIMPIAAVQHAIRKSNAHAGIMITASHNEPDWNGLKFLDASGAILRPAASNFLIEEFHKENGFKPISQPSKVEERRTDTIKSYAQFVKETLGEQNLQLMKKNKRVILVDPNGGTGLVIKDIAKELGLNNIITFNDKPGTFTRKIEPTKESLEYLKDIIFSKKMAFAAGFDADADRVEIVLKDGRLVDGNQLLALVVDDILKENKGTVVTNDATSQMVKAIAHKHKCQLKEVEVGEINVVQEMQILDSPIGGEGTNGGIIIAPSTSRDGILTLFYILKIISQKNQSIEQLIKALPKFYSKQMKTVTPPLDQMTLKAKLKEHYKDKKQQQTGDETGGLKIWIHKDTFVWFRASKTESNLLRIIADSPEKEETERVLEEAFQVIKNIM